MKTKALLISLLTAISTLGYASAVVQTEPLELPTLPGSLVCLIEIEALSCAPVGTPEAMSVMDADIHIGSMWEGNNFDGAGIGWYVPSGSSCGPSRGVYYSVTSMPSGWDNRVRSAFTDTHCDYMTLFDLAGADYWAGGNYFYCWPSPQWCDSADLGGIAGAVSSLNWGHDTPLY